jgi:DNA repair exonuclease SbcCD ATPase subunit
MASRALFAALVISCSLAQVSMAAGNQDAVDETGVAGVQKVIQMLGDMSAKAKQEKKDEEVAFAEFQTWCKMQIPATKKAIAQGGEEIELLSAEIAKLTKEAEVLGEEIAKLESDVSGYEAEKKEKEGQREKDHKAFIEESTDYGESLSALDRAISVIMSKSADKPGASAALLQLAEGERLPEKAKSMIAAFIGMMGGDLAKDMAPGMDYEAPEANAYEFQGGGIVEMLKKLKDEFRGKLGECQKEEMNSKHAFDMIVTDLVDSIENSKATIEEKTLAKTRKQEKAASNKKELAETIECKKADEKTLSDMEVECEEKKLSFGEKQQLRTEEIEAIQQAIEILKSPDVAGSAGKHLDLAQTKKASPTFAQLRSADRNEGINVRVRTFIAQEGNRLHSRDLALLAEKLAADPFAKVKKLIDDMITRLLNEANEDAQHEGFCDEEMGKNKVTRNKLSEDIDALEASVEEGKSTIMHLTDDVATLSKEVAELESSMVESTKLRKEEKATNKVTVEDAEAAQKAVAAATAVLKTFYEKAAMATGLLQMDRPKMGTDEWKSLANPNFEGGDKGLKTGDSWGHTEGMQTFGEKYTGQQDEAGGVLAMLEVIASDFANLEAETKATEAASQTTYDDFMVEAKKNKATKEKKIEMNAADKASTQTKVEEDTKDLKGTQDELLAADRYYAKLVPQCIDKGMTFGERTKARESEIASLKQALKILG